MERSSLLRVADIISLLQEEDCCDPIDDPSLDEFDDSSVEKEGTETDTSDFEDEPTYAQLQPNLNSRSIPRSSTMTLTEKDGLVCSVETENVERETINLYFNSKKDFFWNSVPQFTDNSTYNSQTTGSLSHKLDSCS